MKNKITLFAMIIVIFCTLFALSAKSETITLTETNHVFLRDRVSNSSVDEIIKEIADLDAKLKKDDPIYLVLDTPGGSIIAGWKLIQFVKSIDRKIHTISIYAASMGFQFVQAFGIRYFTDYSIIMAHHGSTQCEGTLKDIKSCASMLETIDKIENDMAARRIGIDPQDWSKYIEEDRYFIGDEILYHSVGDKKINLKCSKELINKKKTVKKEMLFSSIEVEVSACPLM